MGGYSYSMLRFLSLLLFALCLGLQGAELSPRETVQACRRRLESPQASERREAVLILGKYSLPEVSELLGGSLEDADGAVRLAALVSLSENPLFLRQQSFRVRRLLRDPEVQVRRLASSLLSACLEEGPFAGEPPAPGEPGELSSLLADALADEDGEVRRNVLKATPFFHGSLPLASLAPFLDAPSLEVLSLAIPLVVRAEDAPSLRLAALSPLLEHPSPAIRELLARRLGELPGSEAALERLSRDASLSVRGEALLSRCRLASPQEGGALQEEVLALLSPSPGGESLSPEMLRRLLFALEGLSPQAAKEAVLARLGEERETGRLETLWMQVLRHQGWQKEVPLDLLVGAMAAHGGEPRLRSLLLSLLRKRAGEMGPGQLAALQGSPSPEARRSVLDLLRFLPASLGEEALMGCLTDEEVSLRARALEVLSSLRPLGWEELLAATLEDPEPSLQVTAAQGLARAGRLPPQVREAVALWLPQCPDPALGERLRKCLERR